MPSSERSIPIWPSAAATWSASGSTGIASASEGRRTVEPIKHAITAVEATRSPTGRSGASRAESSSGCGSRRRCCSPPERRRPACRRTQCGSTAVIACLIRARLSFDPPKAKRCPVKAKFTPGRGRGGPDRDRTLAAGARVRCGSRCPRRFSSDRRATGGRVAKTPIHPQERLSFLPRSGRGPRPTRRHRPGVTTLARVASSQRSA